MEPRRLIAVLACVLAFSAWLVSACEAGPDGLETEGSRTPVGSADLRSPGAAETRIPRSLPRPPEPATPEAVFEHLTDGARKLARREYRPPSGRLPASLTGLDYDEYRSIRFRPEAALWRDESLFEIQLFHPGSRHGDPVRIHLVEEDRVTPVRFDRDRFRYGERVRSARDAARPGIGHAGFRVHYPLNGPDSKDEVAVFLGASYFRLLGAGHVHGLSSRGLAVNTAEPGGEEFPDFREFWLVRPGPRDTTLTFFSLLDGPSVTGAYRFELDPGDPTTMDVEARLFARRDVAKLGVAPLTSMFLHGESRARDVDDFRPRVHDSEGLLMHTSAGEWIWRPLSNGPGLSVTQLRDRTPRGFGLVQRHRDFEDYLDLEARYDRRPSEWVSVGEGDWGSGGVELVEIPTDSEFNDNIVAYWARDEPFRAGDERRYRYRLRTFDARLEAEALGRVERTRSGRDGLPGQADSSPRGPRRFVVDFVGGELPSLDPRDPVEAVVSTSAGRTADVRARPLPDDEGWRATFRLVPGDERPADLRLYLELRGRRLTETWSYVWYPDRAR